MTELLIEGAAGVEAVPGFLVPIGSGLPFIWAGAGPRDESAGNASPYCSFPPPLAITGAASSWPAGIASGVTELMVGYRFQVVQICKTVSV